MAEVEKLKEKALAWPERAQEITIVDQESYDGAAELLKEIVEIRRNIQNHYKPIKDAAHRAHKAAVAGEKELLDPLSKAETWIKSKLGDWQREQNRIAEEQRRKLEAEQRQREEEERLKLAEDAERAGMPDEVVNEILDTPMPVVPIATPVKTYEQASGISTRMLYGAEVTNLRVLCMAIGQGRAPESLVMPNAPALNGMARAMKEAFQVPGCKLVKTESVAVRT